MAEPSIYGEIAIAIPVIIGALLAMSGGLLSQLLINRLDVQRDQNALRRGHLETFVKALFAQTQWHDNASSAMVTRGENLKQPAAQ